MVEFEPISSSWQSVIQSSQGENHENFRSRDIEVPVFDVSFFDSLKRPESVNS